MPERFNDDHHHDDEEEDSMCSDFLDPSSSTLLMTPEPSSERDEVQEVHKMSRKDTLWVKLWRLVTTAVLLLTAFAVTYTTYRFLKDEERQNFETAFERFSRTVGDAAIGQQRDFRNGLKAFGELISQYAVQHKQTWPFVTVDGFESYSANFRTMSHTEVYGWFPLVTHENRDAWVNYSITNYQRMVKEAHKIHNDDSLERLVDPNNTQGTYHPYISMTSPSGFVEDIKRDLYYPTWHFSPPPRTYGLLNLNMANITDYDNALKALTVLRNETVVTRVRPYTVGVPVAFTKEEHDLMHRNHPDADSDHPHSFAWRAVHENHRDAESPIVGYLGGASAWDEALLDLLPEGVNGIHAVVENDCDQSYTYEIRGKDAYFEGEGDLHEPAFDEMRVTVDLALHTHPDFPTTPGHCQYQMHVYPTAEFRSSYDSNTPEIFAAVVAATFVMVAIVFFTYDLFVQKRNENLVHKAAQSNAIVTSLFPDTIRDRLMDQKQEAMAAKKKNKEGGGNLKTFMNDGKHNQDGKSKPLADLFLDTTTLNADIVGFTAWSSVRSPEQVFTLLESVYQAFDRIAKARKIYKVETVGDCYVAVAGLPDPMKDHAVAMARFARDIIARMHVLTKELEVVLGPDTGDLNLRVGMHSGPVTAGVLRGDRARFQLFGMTMNMTAKLEYTGQAGRIQCSKETAQLLNNGGKGAWLEKRPDTNTYWVMPKGKRQGTEASIVSEEGAQTYRTSLVAPGKALRIPGLDEKTLRLIDWNVETLLQLLKQVVSLRNSRSLQRMNSSDGSNVCFAATPLEEVREIITLPEFNAKAVKRQQDPETIQIPEPVVNELRLLVSKIASLYRKNPFHNFEHASHVVMSVTKLMSRIVAPEHLDNDTGNEQHGDNKMASDLHDHTYGVASDPLTQFACAFSALIHDVDHQGVSNAQLVKEEEPLCERYGPRSVAEQNSLDLSWDLLMGPDCASLRTMLFPRDSELRRFRQLVVNSVMATDIVDKDMKELRNRRWDKAFKKGDSAFHVDENPRDEVNRKATIVIEHIIQASDISHTMQHWHVYRKWNENLFEELYVAYMHGRLEKDPATFWYKGEFGFFDFYIIPLTKKLKECGVFGVSSGEFLDYAIKNREEWELQGQEVVAGMIAKCTKKYGIRDGKGEVMALPAATTIPPPEQAPPLRISALENETDC